MDVDYFADMRNSDGKVTTETAEPDTQEVIDEMAKIDNQLLDEGEAIFRKYVIDRNWLVNIDDTKELPLLGRYLRSNPEKRFELVNWTLAKIHYPILADIGC